jgi:methylmalonyl-CoA mutase
VHKDREAPLRHGTVHGKEAGMTDAPTNLLSFAAEFPPATRDDWLRLVQAVLKGAPFERLVAKTYDGLPIEPISPRRTDAVPIAGRALAAPWQVMARVDHPDPAAANAEALHELENGATGLSLVFAGGAGARGFGIADATKETLARVLDGIVLDAGVGIALNPVLGGQNAGANFAAIVAERGIAPAAVDVRFNYQPLSTMAVRGDAPAPWSEMALPFANIVRDLKARGFAGPFALADGRPIHDAGGSEAQELAFALATALAYLRALEAEGFTLDDARAALSFRLSADADQFLTTAKFRALRKLWARVEDACGLAPKPVFVAAETAWRVMTRRDPHVNILRTTIAVIAAGLGGADAITVLPFTMAIGLPDRFARRVARNSQLILLEESNLTRVTDPAAGSGTVEGLTDQLCHAAWTLFQEIETAGGAAAALETGLIQDKVAAVRTARQEAIADGREAITGTTVFPNPGEVPVAVLDVAPRVPSHISGTMKALTPMRLAEPYEG